MQQIKKEVGGGDFREMETTIHTNNILLYPSPLEKIEEN